MPQTNTAQPSSPPDIRQANLSSLSTTVNFVQKISPNVSRRIRMLASHVDKLMRQVSRKGYDQLSAAILVTLNLAEQMYEERKNSPDFLHGLIQGIDEVIKRDDNLSDCEATYARRPLGKASAHHRGGLTGTIKSYLFAHRTVHSQFLPYLQFEI